MLIELIKMEVVEIAQLLKCLLHRHKGLYLITRAHIRKPGTVDHVCNLRLGYKYFRCVGFSD